MRRLPIKKRFPSYIESEKMIPSIILPLVECQGQHHLKLAPKRSQEMVHDENCCNGYGWIIKMDCECQLKEVYCHRCNSDGFTTKKLPKEGDWYNSLYETFSPKDAPRGAFEVKKVEIKENLTWQSIAPFKVEKIVVVTLG